MQRNILPIIAGMTLGLVLLGSAQVSATAQAASAPPFQATIAARALQETVRTIPPGPCRWRCSSAIQEARVVIGLDTLAVRPAFNPQPDPPGRHGRSVAGHGITPAFNPQPDPPGRHSGFGPAQRAAR